MSTNIHSMLTAASVLALLPRWTKRVSIEEGSRDPLGLSRVSSLVTDFLLQGIITQTYRARYYSFYCWAIWHIRQEEKPSSYEEFALAFQRRDTLFALATLHANRESSSVVGKRVAEAKLQTAEERREVPVNFRVLPSNALGAFGQYYTGSIYELGLTSRDEHGIYDASESGEMVARAFHEMIVATPYIKKKLFVDNSISWTDFTKTAENFNLDALGRSAKERELLTKLFFSEELRSDRALMRRSSLALLMYVIEAYKTIGLKLNYTNRWEIVYAPFYYRELQVSKTKTRNFNIPQQESACAEFWQYFCLHQFITQALENLLTATLDEVAGEESGLTLPDICSRLSSEQFAEELREIHGKSLHTPSELMSSLGLASAQLDAAACRRNQATYGLLHPESESRVLDREPKSPSERTALAVSLLALSYAKWARLHTDAARMVSSQVSSELHAASVFPYIDSWFDTGLTWAESIEPILSELVLDQHDRIMYGKGKLESCWVHRSEGKVVKDQDYFPTYRSPRSDNSISILNDLGLVAIDSDDDVSLSPRGRALLRKLIP